MARAASDLQNLGLRPGPDLELLLQTLWPSKKQSLTAKIGTVAVPSSPWVSRSIASTVPPGVPNLPLGSATDGREKQYNVINGISGGPFSGGSAFEPLQSLQRQISSSSMFAGSPGISGGVGLGLKEVNSLCSQMLQVG